MAMNLLEAIEQPGTFLVEERRASAGDNVEEPLAIIKASGVNGVSDAADSHCEVDEASREGGGGAVNDEVGAVEGVEGERATRELIGTGLGDDRFAKAAGVSNLLSKEVGVIVRELGAGAMANEGEAHGGCG